MEIKINLNETVKVKLTDYGKDVYYHQFDDLNKRIIKNGGKPIEPHFPKEDENGYCEMQLWGLMDLYGNYMSMGPQNVFKPFQIIYECELKENDLINRQKAEIERLNEKITAKDESNYYLMGQLRLEKEIRLTAKSEAIKEFAERLKIEIISDTAYGCDCNQHSGYYDYTIKIGDIPEYIDNLVKEMMERERLLVDKQRKEDEWKC